jgi:hypothetical protein
MEGLGTDWLRVLFSTYSYLGCIYLQNQSANRKPILLAIVHTPYTSFSQLAKSEPLRTAEVGAVKDSIYGSSWLRSEDLRCCPDLKDL